MKTDARKLNVNGKVTFVRPVMAVLNGTTLWGLYTQRTEGEPVATDLNPKALQRLAHAADAKEVRCEYDLKLEEGFH